VGENTWHYDALDRPIRLSYPDGTYEEIAYTRLDMSVRRDRAGRVTRYFHDALGRVAGTRDPLGRMIGQAWCSQKYAAASCSCSEDGCGQWRARASLTLILTVSLLDGPDNRVPPDVILREEMKHINAALAALQARVRAGEAREKRRFGSRVACQLACGLWVAGTYWAFWNDTTHRTDPHPRR
jgi:YD repeat-containing protein